MYEVMKSLSHNFILEACSLKFHDGTLADWKMILVWPDCNIEKAYVTTKQPSFAGVNHITS